MLLSRSIVVLLAFGGLTACSRAGFWETDADLLAGRTLPESLTVEPLYPVNGADWNDYVIDDGDDLLLARDRPCSAGAARCLHGGELRRVVVDGVPSCDGLTLTDALAAFSWTCRAEGEDATFYSVGLAAGAGLVELLDGGAWRPNPVTVSDGTDSVASASLVWWGNGVSALPDNGASGTDALYVVDAANGHAPGDILIVDGSFADSQGINLALDRIALVGSGAGLTFAGGPANCAADGTAGSAAVCLIAAGAQGYLWIEGTFAAGATSPADFGVLLVGTHHSRLHAVEVSDTGDDCISLESADFNTLTEIHVIGCGDNGVSLDGSTGNRLRDVYASGPTNDGVHLEGSTGTSGFRLSGSGGEHGLWLSNDSSSNRFVHVFAGNNREGIGIRSSHDNVFVSVVAGNNREDAIYADDCTRNTISHVTAANGGYFGLDLRYGSDENTIVQLLAVNNDSDGLYLENSSRFLLAQLAAANNTNGVHLDGSSANLFSHHLLLGNNSGADCVVTAGSNPGIDGACVAAAELVAGVDGTAAFAGKVLAPGDAVNASDTDGAADLTGIDDWTGFESPFRLWGNDGGDFPEAGNRNWCTAGVCRIWDWRLAGAASNDFWQTSGDGRTANGPLTAGAPCPLAAHGDVAMTDQQMPPNTFLLNAIELLEDQLGDDDGLCESDEACLFSTHFGAFQGEGALTDGPCTFTDGLVERVSLRGYVAP